MNDILDAIAKIKARTTVGSEVFQADEMLQIWFKIAAILESYTDGEE